MGVRKPDSSEEAQWEKLIRFVQLYSWLTIGGVLFGVALAHKVLFTGQSWTTCAGKVGCVLTFHLMEVPLVIYLVVVAIYGLGSLSRATLHRFYALLSFANVVALVFGVFEIIMLLNGFARNAPTFELVALALVASVLLFGAGLGLALLVRINSIFYPLQDLRYVHPTTEKELVTLVKKAQSEGLALRVRGSAHSVYQAIYADESPPGNINVQLDLYNRILHWDTTRKRVTVQAGCHLGVDPRDPRSNRKNSLLWQLERRGWALPDLGGITHQTVAGFLSTGSAGGTTHFDVGASVVGLRLIDGTGQCHDLAPNPDDPDDRDKNPFYAAGVSMGLLGLLSTVTLQCVERFDIIGKQVTTRTADSPVDLFGAGTLEQYFRDTQYTRLLWWPQQGVDTVQTWQARRTNPDDAPMTHRQGRFVPKPFISVPGGKLSQALIQLFFNVISHDAPPYEPATQEIIRTVLNAFLQEDTEEFWDIWLQGLPMDNQISDEFMPTEFTELFIDIHKTTDVMRALKRFYAEDEALQRTGAYAVEIYPAQQSDFWMSPSYGMDTVRVDVFWFKTRRGNPATDFYPQYWKLLEQFDFRFHWGKYLSAPDSSTGVEYRKKQCPKWDDFLALRKKMDPHDIFLTSYWAAHLGIKTPLTPLAAYSGSGAPR